MNDPEPESNAASDEGRPEPANDSETQWPTKDLRQPAYDAVYEVIGTLPNGGGAVERNAIIWRAVHAALNATPVGRCISSHCVEEDHILDVPAA